MVKHTINPQLLLKIKQQLTKNPKHTQDTLLQSIMNNYQLRLNKQGIKYGIKQYYKQNPPNPIIIDKQQQNQYEQIRKKLKTQQQIKNSLQFKDESHQYDLNNLAAITSQLKNDIEENIFIPISNKNIFQTLNINPIKGYILNGTIGSGKTQIAYCILSYVSNFLGFNTYLINCSMNDSEHLKKVFEEIQNDNTPTMIFFDDLQFLCNKDNKKGPTQTPLMYTLINYINKLDSKDVYFLASTSSLEKIDLSLKKTGKFQKIITIDSLTQESRKNILEKLLEKTPNTLSKQNYLSLAEITSGYVMADLISLIKQSSRKCVLRTLSKNESTPRITMSDMQQSFKNIQPLLKKEGFANIPDTKLSDIGALDKLKSELYNEIILPLKQRQKFKQMNFQINGAGVLLYGPPGCGKTMLAKAIANQAKANFIIVKGPQLLTKYVGQSQEAVRKVFERARMSSPCIIFFDQFDALAPKRQDQGNQVTQRVVNTLLNQLNGVDQRKMVFVICATNRPDIIDQAILRSGRIQKHLQVPLPNQKERIDILKTIAKNVQKQQIDFELIAAQSEGFSGADLRYLIKQSVVKAIMNNRNFITMNDMQNARKAFSKDKVAKSKLMQSQEDNKPVITNGYNIEQQGQLNNNINKSNQKNDNIIKQFMEFMFAKQKNMKNKLH